MYHYLALWAIVAFVIFKAVNYVLLKRQLAGMRRIKPRVAMQRAYTNTSLQHRPKSWARKSLQCSPTVASEV